MSLEFYCLLLLYYIPVKICLAMRRSAYAKYAKRGRGSETRRRRLDTGCEGLKDDYWVEGWKEGMSRRRIIHINIGIDVPSQPWPDEPSWLLQG